MEDKKITKGQPQPTYLVQPGQAVQLVDGINIESKGELMIISLFMSEGNPPQDSEGKDEETPPWVSFCHGRFAMTKSSYALFVQLMSKHLDDLMKNKAELNDASK